MDQDGDVHMHGTHNDIPIRHPTGSNHAEAQAFLDQLDLKRQGSLLAVPTDDNDVRAKLRQLGEPITYFGEDKGDRRGRLRELLVLKQREGTMDVNAFLRTDTSLQPGGDDEDEEEEYYTEGGAELKHARRLIYKYSIEKAKARIQQQTHEAQQTLQLHVKNRRQVYDRVKKFTTRGAQTGFTRPVSCTKVSYDSKHIAAADWSGSVRLFTVENMDQTREYIGHTGKVGGLAWNPGASSENSFNFVTGGLEGDVHMWSLDRNEPIATCKGHESQVNKVDVHPSGRYIGSASHDYTWRLWDVETQQELLLQEGHSKEVVAFKFQHEDGALAASAGMDAVGRVWDLRSGKTVYIMDGHIQAIHSLDFSPNGYQVATASADNSVMIWDLRQTKRLATIPAHTSLVSDVAYYRGDRSYEGLNESGTFLLTSSYDKTIKAWSADNWALQHTMQDSNKILSLDMSRDQQFIVSGRWDRYVKLWAPSMF